jgi:small-conductance mechanosensitive channel
MAFDVGVALTWILYLALFPMAFFWLRRAWRVLVRRDFSEVALKRGEAPPNAERWAPYTMVINGVAGTVVVVVIVSVVLFGLPYDTWTAIAGTTIWSKFFLDFALSRHAHGFAAKKKA